MPKVCHQSIQLNFTNSHICGFNSTIKRDHNIVSIIKLKRAPDTEFESHTRSYILFTITTVSL